MNAEAGDKDHRSGQGVDVALQLAERNEAQPPGRESDQGKHGADRGQTKGRGDQDDAEGIMPGSRVHDEGNERLARPEDKDDEEDPGCEGGLSPAAMEMIVIGLMDVGVGVLPGFRVGMSMAWGLFLSALQSPQTK